MKRLSHRDDRGASLIELLVAMAIMGTAVVALLGAIAASIRLSDVHRHQATAGAYIKEFAEKLEQGVQSSGYPDCTPGSNGNNLKDDYEGFFPTALQPNYTRRVTDVKFWDGTGGWLTICPGAGDVGVQLVSLEVKYTTGGDRAVVTERLDVTVRKPCRPGDAQCS